MSAYLVLGIAVAAALASPVGGVISLWRRPTTLFMSLALGFASGVLLATISFEMIPQAVELSSLAMTVIGFVAGFLAVYALDLIINRGRLVGEKAEQKPDVERFHRRHRPRGDQVTVLAGGTSTEELIEGLSIGIGAAIEPGLGSHMWRRWAASQPCSKPTAGGFRPFSVAGKRAGRRPGGPSGATLT
jgi:ZIP family zinc transporter